MSYLNFMFPFIQRFPFRYFEELEEGTGGAVNTQLPVLLTGVELSPAYHVVACVGVESLMLK